MRTQNYDPPQEPIQARPGLPDSLLDGLVAGPSKPGEARGERLSRKQKLLELLLKTTLRLRLQGVDLESSTGLSGRELDLVALLSASGPTSVKSLVADLGVPRSTMTAIVDRLEARELVRRLPNPQDRRSVILEATPSAIQALLRYREGMLGFVEHVESVLDEDEQAELTRLIEKLDASL